MPADDYILRPRDEAIREAREFLTRLEREQRRLTMELHRAKARLWRLEAAHEDAAADELRRLLEPIDAAEWEPDSTGEDGAGFERLDEPAAPTRTIRAGADVAPAPHRHTTTFGGADRATRAASSAGRGASAGFEFGKPLQSLLPGKKPLRDWPGTTAARGAEFPGLAPTITEKSADFRRPGRGSRGERKRRRTVPPWTVSLGVHAVLICLLGLFSFATLRSEPLPLVASGPVAVESLLETVPVQMETPVTAEQEQVASLLETVPLDVESLIPSELLSELSPADPAASLGSSSLLPLDVGNLLSGGGTGRAGGGPARGGASFFGASARGERFVYVVDNSGSMREGRMETTLHELMQSVAALAPSQRFFVIFFSDQAYPMFFPDAVDELVPATRENKRRLADWLTTVELCTGGQIKPALELAASLEPQVIYLLTDGQMGATSLDYLTQDNGWPFIVHTLGMTVRNAEHAANLMAISQAHGGIFVPVSVNPAAAALNKQNPLRFRREGGSVWGTKVR